MRYGIHRLLDGVRYVSPEKIEQFGTWFDAHVNWSGVHNIEIQQAVGILDQNGTEIFEGDLLEIEVTDYMGTCTVKGHIRWNQYDLGYRIYDGTRAVMDMEEFINEHKTWEKQTQYDEIKIVG